MSTPLMIALARSVPVSLSTWTQRNCSLHGGRKVFLVPRQMAVVFGHLSRAMSHQLSEGLDVHAIDDRHGAKLVPDAVHGGICRHTCFQTEPS